MRYYLIEKKNRLALHGIFHSLESAKRHLKEAIPEYVARGYFMNKTLKASDFKIVKAEVK